MARMRVAKKSTRQAIEVFLGLNRNSTGDTGLKYGESGNCQNVIGTKDFKAQRIRGYLRLFEALGTTIDGAWYGRVANVNYFIIATDGNILTVDLTTGARVNIGTMTASRTSFFGFADKLYAMNGTQYKVWTGTGSFADVAGYIPKVAVNTPPAGGGGTDYEDFNMLTGKKHQTFNGNGSANVYKLYESNVGSVDQVYVGGVLKTVTTHYTVDLTAGTITFTAGNIPSTGLDNVDIYWTKGTGERALFLGNKYAVAYGSINDTRIFFWGDSNAKNRVRYSTLADGIPSAEYISAEHYGDIGSSNYDIRDIQTNQGNLIIQKEDYIHSGTVEFVTEQTSGLSNLVLTTSPLTRAITYPYNQGRIVNGVPVQVGTQLYRILGTYLKDERNVQPFSDRILSDLSSVDLTTAVTLDYEKEQQYWISVGTSLWIYRYDTDTFWYVKLAHTPTCYIEVNGVVYFGTSTGTIMKFDDTVVDFDGTDLDWYWHMNMESFGAEYLRKTCKKVHISTNPTADQYVQVDWYTDNKGLTEGTQSQAVVDYHMNYENIDYANWSYNTTYSPKPTRIKMNAKKFTYLALRLNGGGKGKKATVLKITPKITYGGESK